MRGIAPPCTCTPPGTSSRRISSISKRQEEEESTPMLRPHPLLRFESLPNLLPSRFPLSLSLNGPRTFKPCSPPRTLCTASQFELDLDRMLAVLTEDKRRMLAEHPEFGDLIEVVIDLGRKPLARFPDGDLVLSEHPITVEDIQHAVSQVGDFAVDNRAGISRTLHRISAIRNRKGKIIGLTCRVGRALPGSANSLRDLIEDGASLLLIGPPGVGKTTIIRDIARMLANDYKKRVMIVDTSNEIGGDGDIPHAGIGDARRMQVPHSDEQHKVLIEAVENHMPQVIVIDEIGTKLEAAAACTISQRGIQLVGTAHGVTFENVVMNPALEMLVGGVQSVTLGDEEASRRRVQKTVLERKGPSPFSCGVEIITKAELRVHRHLEATVDAILQGRRPNFEVRRTHPRPSDELESGSLIYDSTEPKENSLKDKTALCIFLYGISETSAIQGIRQLNLDETFEFTDNISEADVLLASQSKLRKNAQLQAAARSRGIPTYVTKTSSLSQISKAVQALMSDYADGFESYESKVKANDAEKIDALEEARIAIEQIVISKREPVDLLPRASNILLLQKDLIRKYNLKSERFVSEDGLQHLRILPLPNVSDEFEDADDATSLGNFYGSADESNGSAYSVERLPLLPD
ncbi:protein SEEDLING PLASTID DEVELOPMENT 1-like isoform X2 [Andrographis paniculata]|uniref:protein SEEDLING PLASTID DEVELOPMENT 1-like isoform X2 n=1 Tax=Andrographis paniculata TaxID=175694 RepID=UPI0021E7ED2F|nr:protein SEEDLING PLASTID DEVELOPMENT 1-like isoform X2 [Andrographis paniculata]